MLREALHHMLALVYINVFKTLEKFCLCAVCSGVVAIKVRPEATATTTVLVGKRCKKAKHAAVNFHSNTGEH